MATYKDVFSIHANTNTHSFTHTSRYFQEKTKKEGSDWLNQNSHAARPIKSTTQIWLVTRHQYGISALVSQTSFGGETSGSVAKFWLFSQANHPLSSRWYVAAQPGDTNWFVSLIPCEQSKNIERLRVKEVSGQFFSQKFVRCHVNAALESCLWQTTIVCLYHVTKLFLYTCPFTVLVFSLK